LPVDAVQYAGVFIADPDVDDIFKASEPPSHDDWRASTLPNRTDRSAIISAERDIRTTLEAIAAPIDTGVRGRGGGAVAELARDLAGLLPGLDGPGAESQERERAGGTRTKRRRARVRIIGMTGPTMVDGVPTVQVSCTVDHIEGTEGTMIGAKARIALDEGAFEVDPPAGSAAPTVRFWTAPDGSRVEAERVYVDAADRGVWTVHVAGVPDLVTGVEIEPVAG
jgi:hypothetical protein